MIFNLDRYIVSSMRKEGKTAKELLIATPRILLAILISVVIAKPLELKIFEKEIEPELIVMEQQKYSEQESQVRFRFQGTHDSLKTAIDGLQHEIAVKAAKRDENGFAPLGEVGQIAGNRSSFDVRSYGYARLSDMIADIPNFVTERIDGGPMRVKRVR